MSQADRTLAGRRPRPPHGDGEAWVEPPAAEVPALVQRNVSARDHAAHCDILGCSLAQLRDVARQDVLRRAIAHTTAYRDVQLPCRPHTAAPIILSGHQPQLFHPGIWYKNFLLSEFADRTCSHAINLVIDTDTIENVSIRVPSGSMDEPIQAWVALDVTGERVPYEERAVADPAFFASFGSRVQAAISPLVQRPLGREFWLYAVQTAHRTNNLGQSVAQARHRLEGDWGLNTLELPLSSVCDLWSFRWFAVRLLAGAHRLRRIHNDCLAEYRCLHRLRGRARPVPDLTEADGCIEVPFWLWKTDQPKRLPAFVRRRGREMELSNNKDIRIALPLGESADAGRCVERLGHASRKGIRFRPRALITTMFSRLVLSDLFIHGIGGAKYDQVTDAIVRRLFRIDLPGHLTATATFKLPIPRTRVELGDLQRVKRLLRELHYHPELHVEVTPETAPLIAEKRRWISAQWPPARRGHR